MLKHLFVLIWNKKKQNFVLLLEMLVSFLVIFGIFTMLVYYYKNYRKPMNFSYDHVWTIDFHGASVPQAKDSLWLYFEGLRNQLKSMKEVKEVSYTGANTPFSMSSTQNNLTYKGQKVTRVNDYTIGDDYLHVLDAKMVEGRWFSKADLGSNTRSVVINQLLKDKLFGNEPAVGKLLDKESERPFKVIGIVENMKDKGDYQALEYGMWRRMDTGNLAWLGKIILKVAPEANTAFEGRLYKSVSGYLHGSTVEIEHLTDKRITKNNLTLIPMIIMMVVAGFLVLNVALGLFGVLWYNINRRKAEIGLRRAIGATGNAVSRQLVYESLVLATISLILGSFFAVQFPLLHVFDMASDVYFTAIALAILFIYALVVLCALYPGKQAAAIYPAVALHED